MLTAGEGIVQIQTLQVFEWIRGEQGNKILSIRSVRAASKVLDSLNLNLPPDRAKCILHSEARRAIEYGCYLSNNTEMLRNPKSRTLVERLPLDRLLTETDGPFIERNGRPLRPRNIPATVDALATLRNISLDKMKSTLVQNLRAMLQ
jgi:TatD DNase family protein